MKQIFSIFFLTIFMVMNSQNKYEYFGALKLNGSDKSLITYKIVFSITNSNIEGYSITDLGGENETKNSIKGVYNKKGNQFIFNEDDIIYTKSTYKEESFCFVNFEGKMKSLDNKSKIDGIFRGLYKNNKKCIDGTLVLIGAEKINKLVNKVNNKIQSSKKVDQQTKNKVNPLRMMDSLKVNHLYKNQNLNIFAKSNSVILEIWDNNIEDGDVINLYQNDKLILKNYEVSNIKKKLSVNLETTNVFKIEAVSQGYDGPNTTKIAIYDDGRVFELETNLKKDEKNSITILKK